MSQRLIDLKGKNYKSTIIVENFIILLSVTDRKIKQGIFKYVNNLNSTINHLALIDIHKSIHPTIAEYTFFSSVQETFKEIYHILGHILNFNKFKRIERKQRIFLDHKGIKLKLNNRKISGKPPNIWKLNNTFLNNT